MRTTGLLTAVLCLLVCNAVEAQNYTCTSETAATKCLTVNSQNFWIVGEVRSFAFGGDTKSKIVQELRARGWLECEGQSLSNDDFPELANALGTTWGSRDAQLSFLVPDLRSAFLRGWNHSGSQAWQPQFPDPGPRVPPRTSGDVGTGGNTGNKDGVGSMEASGVGSHSHNLEPAYKAWKAKTLPGDGLYVPIIEDTIQAPLVSISNPNPTSVETRPSNAYVMYFIYVGPYDMRQVTVDPQTQLTKRIKKPSVAKKPNPTKKP